MVGYRADDNFESKKCRWGSYKNYTIIIWVWMMNEITVMYSPAEIAHNGFYFHGLLQACGVIFIGIPLVYSEICIAQYTNCNIITMWNFCPLFRYVGFATVYLLILKTIYLMVLTSWYMEYSFFSVLNPPPWYTCDDYNTTKCMVKSVNVSIFQHCIEAQMLFHDDCEMKTASYCFFEGEIGNNNTRKIYCFLQWKQTIACSTISLVLFGLSLRKDKYFSFLTKLLTIYVCIVLIILFCVVLSTKGTWYSTAIILNWTLIDLESCFNSVTRGILSLGTGTGMIIFITQDVPFRSPATMTSIATSLFALVSSIMYAFVCFSGIKTMSYFHGEEENVVEMGDSIYFSAFASISEITTYFNELTLWGFCWFSSISFCLFANVWMLHLYLADILFEFRFASRYEKFTRGVLIIFTSLLSWPFFCSDLIGALTDAIELIEIMTNLLFSVAFYWIYGFNNHNIDIIFMIGIKASYFWKIAWLLNPILLVSILYFRFIDLELRTYGGSFEIKKLESSVVWILLYVLVGIYIGIVCFGLLFQFIYYLRHVGFRDLFVPTEDWGPRDKILFKSRKMFVPEIMTTEFLYRQVRIRGYYVPKKSSSVQNDKKPKLESSKLHEDLEWSPLTSN